jgi:hypothetical protein
VTEGEIKSQKHSGLAWGWLVVNPLGVTEPMVGWKQAPLLAFASHYLVLISVFILYVFNWELMGA